MNRCPDAFRLDDYLRGNLAAAVAAEIAEHLAHCADCEQIADRLASHIRPGDTPGPATVRATEFASDSISLVAEDRLRSLGLARTKLDPTGRLFATPRDVPERLGHYQILGTLGRGGMGLVYHALHTELERPVAIKVLLPGQGAGALAVERFRREMRALGKLRHPNVVAALDAGQIDGIHYLAMEFIEGVSLADLLARCGPLRLADACELVRQTAVGLQFVHDQRLIHRDVKPANLMLCQDGQVKILDFGLALRLNDEADDQSGEITSAGQLVGTRSYMAPEQTVDSHAVDMRTDIYSLGCTFYRLLAGRNPHASNENASPGGAPDSSAADTKEAMAWLRQARPTIPLEVSGLLQRMLAPDRNDRFGSFDQVATALAPFCGNCDLSVLVGDVLPIDAKQSPSGSVAPVGVVEASQAGQDGHRHPSSPTWPILAHARLPVVVLLTLLVAWAVWRPLLDRLTVSTAEPAGDLPDDRSPDDPQLPPVPARSPALSQVRPTLRSRHARFSDGWLVRQSDAGPVADAISHAIASDEHGDLYVTGSLELIAASGVRSRFADVFIAKYSATGQTLWFHRLGGAAGDNRGNAIGVDPLGAVYVAGQFQGTVDFDPGPGQQIRTSSDGTIDAFLLKLTSAGEFDWVVTYGQTSARWDQATALTITETGHITLAGIYGGPLELQSDTPLLHRLSSSPNASDLFVVRLNLDGGLDWVRRFGGPERDSVMHLTSDLAGNTYLCGTFQRSLTLDPDNPTINLTAMGTDADAFVIKLHADGSLAWVRQAGGDGFHFFAGLSAGPEAVYAVGAFQNELRFDGDHQHQLTSRGGFDAIVAKLNNDTGEVIWVRQAGGPGDDRARRLVVTESGDVHVVGQITLAAQFGLGTTERSLTSAGERDGFIWRLGSDGTTRGVRRIGGPGDDVVQAICITPDGSLVTTGNLQGRVIVSSPESGSLVRGASVISAPLSNDADLGKDLFVMKRESVEHER